MLTRLFNILLLLTVLAALSPATVRAHPATLERGVLVLTAVQDGFRWSDLQLTMQAGRVPLEFHLQHESFARNIAEPAGYYDGNTLVIPDLVNHGKHYWAELEESRPGVFQVQAYGLRDTRYLRGGPISTQGWQMIPGRALDVGAGSDGSVWVVGEPDYWGQARLYFWIGTDWIEVDGDGERIEVDPWGRPWVVSPDNSLWVLEHTGWRLLHGAVTDVGIGADGSVWVVGVDERRGGHSLYTLDRYGWVKVHGSGVRIDVDPQGYPWVINDDEQIFRWNGTSWLRMPGYARDIGIGADGTVWAVGTNERAGGYGLYRWDGAGWQLEHGSASQVSVDANGNPWVVNRDGEIWLGNFR